jgi:hypothetical protein
MVAVEKKGSRNGPGRGCCVAWAKQGQKQRRAPRLDVYDACAGPFLVEETKYTAKRNICLKKSKKKQRFLKKKQMETKNKQGAPTVISFF